MRQPKSPFHEVPAGPRGAARPCRGPKDREVEHYLRRPERFGLRAGDRAAGPYRLGEAGARLLNQMLPDVLASDHVSSLLETLYYTGSHERVVAWGEGGCITTAMGIRRWWGDGCVIEVIFRPRRRNPMMRMIHVLARVDEYYLDDRGVHRAGEVIAATLHDLGSVVQLAPFDPVAYKGSGVPASRPHAILLARELRHALGPAWRWGEPMTPPITPASAGAA